MDNEEIIQKLINGQSLYSYMIPDDSLSNNRPLHSEGFYLSHIIITGDVFWGMSRTVHLGHYHGSNSYSISHFCYTNHPDSLFFSYSPSLDGNDIITLMSIKRYKSHKFIAKDNWRLIWDSEWDEKHQDKSLDHWIKQGLRFKTAMLDDEDIWNIHPVDLPMFHINEGTFNIKTELFGYPGILRNSKSFNDFIEPYRTFFDKKPDSDEEGALSGKCPSFRAFYNLFDNGEYYNFYDIPRGTKQKYKRLMVFCEKR